jgi:UDP-N-acetylglucosamine 2-epimerase (non-hydrolysing)
VKIVNLVGARPNFVKIAPLIREMRRHDDVQTLLVHTGQHYDETMAGRFFRELDIPAPDASLDVGSGSHAYQTAEVMRRLEPILEKTRPDVLLVVGDVNSTLAGALTAAKLDIAVAHVEAGLRSFDRTMPEEINRRLTDVLSDYLFLTEESGRWNLLREGTDPAKMHLVGNVMIDSLELYRPLWERSEIDAQLGVKPGAYGVVTLHRPSNVDRADTLEGLLRALSQVAEQIPLVFPVHPRTRQRLEALDGTAGGSSRAAGGVMTAGLRLVEPLGYLDFVALVSRARIVFTDSGGLQEEATGLGVDCLTLRETTERPVTVTDGTNHLVGTSPARIVDEARRVLANGIAVRDRPVLWDGRASSRIVDVLRGHASC